MSNRPRMTKVGRLNHPSAGEHGEGTVIHLRVTSPPDITALLVPQLRTNPAVLNLVVLPGAVSNPDGDALQFDVIHAAANDVIDQLRELGLVERGSIILENVDTSLATVADRATAQQGRFHEFTPVWTEVESRITLGGIYPPSWFALLVIASLIGAVGILTNSQILVVGAMVVGPEYGAILSLAYGVTRRDVARIRRGALALVIGFSLAVVGSLILSLIVRAAGLAPEAYTLGVRPVSNLIDTPDWFSLIVAVLAGVVGVVSLSESRSSTLIGVFISVTTIPAASDIGLALAFGSGKEAAGSLAQLLLNITVLAAVAIAGLPAQRALWQRLAHRRVAAPVNLSGMEG